MTLRLACVHCGAKLRLRPELAGRRVRCPRAECRREFTVPALPKGDAAPDEFDELIPPASVRRRQPVKLRSRPRRSSARWRTLAITAAAVLVLGVLGVWRPWSSSRSANQPILAATPVAGVEPAFDEIRPFFQQHCMDCHTGAEAEGGFALDRLAQKADFTGQRRSWERVFKLLSVGNMPPPDVDQPPAEERQKVIDWLGRRLFYVDCSQPVDPGRVTIRRLNKTEYRNTVRDLVGVDYDPTEEFPSDDVGYGFDNIGDVLTVPPLLIEKYLTAAEEISTRAILTGDPQQFSEIASAEEMRSEGSVRDADEGGRIFVSQGTLSRRVTFPRTGDYLIRIDAAADQAGSEPARMRLSIDGREQRVFDIRGERERQVYEARVRVEGERRRVEVSFINDFYEARQGDRNLYVYTVGVTGPVDLPDTLPESHRRLVAARPGDGVDVATAARKNLEPLLYRAFRRPVNGDDVTPYVGFVQQAVGRGDSFEQGLRVALQAVLVSPQFLFRVEGRGSPQWEGRTEPLTDFELASRLSYFLWSSMPDDELLSLAKAGQLRQEATLREQAVRMLRDPKSIALVQNFAGQWLGLRKLQTNEVAPDPSLFPDFSPELRRDIARETELFVAALIKDDRPLTELLTARYSFVNARLAKLYGVSGPKGDAFERVEFTDGHRSGILTHASVLTLTSYPDRTSPVKRGEWVLSNLLGDAPPEPPPVVPALDETRHAHPELSLREQLVLHRADPGCASCHKVMDEIGFGLENFDAIGRWRERDGQHPIDAAGLLPTGEQFRGPTELVEILSGRKEDFARCVTEKLLTFALGRGLEYYDRCAVDRIVSQVQSQEYRMTALVQGVVVSEPFRLRRAAGP